MINLIDNASEEAIDGLNNLSTDRPSSADNESHFILNDLDVQDNRCTMDIQDNRPSLYSLVHVKKEIDRFHQVRLYLWNMQVQNVTCKLIANLVGVEYTVWLRISIHGILVGMV